MQIQRIKNQRPAPKAPVTVKVCGNVIEVRHSVHGPPEITIQKLNADEYIDLRTGVVELFQHTTSRAEDKASVAQSLRNLRDIINSISARRPGRLQGRKSGVCSRKKSRAKTEESLDNTGLFGRMVV